MQDRERQIDRQRHGKTGAPCGQTVRQEQQQSRYKTKEQAPKKRQAKQKTDRQTVTQTDRPLIRHAEKKPSYFILACFDLMLVPAVRSSCRTFLIFVFFAVSLRLITGLSQ